jgi:CMP-N,N'-diacetyllegionaminic acid synthase
MRKVYLIKMIDGHRVIALIPARGGSKGIPKKNEQLLGGKPLIAWPIETALSTPEIDRVVLSTDDENLRSIGLSHGAESYERLSSLATDTTIVIDVIRDFWMRIKGEGETATILVLLEATSPFRTPELVSRCIRRLISENLDSIATFREAAVSPERIWKIVNGIPITYIEGSIPWKPRQLFGPAYQLDGAVYAFFPDRLPENSPSILFGEKGAEIVSTDKFVDIDLPIDLEIANAILKFR